MTFSVKFFTIFSALLAVTVNGSPAGFAEGGLEARSARTLGDVGPCYGPGDCRDFPVKSGECNALSLTAGIFNSQWDVYCYGFSDTSCIHDRVQLWDDADAGQHHRGGLAINSCECYGPEIKGPILPPVIL